MEVAIVEEPVTLVWHTKALRDWFGVSEVVPSEDYLAECLVREDTITGQDYTFSVVVLCGAQSLSYVLAGLEAQEKESL